MKRVKKNAVTSILAVCLAFIMAFSTGMTAAAAEGDLTSDSAGTITISGIETDDSGHGIGTLCAYKVINVNVNNDSHQPQSPVFKWADSVASWVSTNFDDYIDTANGNAVTDDFLELTDNGDDIKAFVDQLANAIRKTDNAIDLAPFKEYPLADYTPAGNDKVITLTEVPLGAYLFLVEGGVRIYSPGFASVYPAYEGEGDAGKWVPSGQSIDVYMKSEEPDIEKSVEDYTYAIGQTVNYTLVVDVPDYPENAVDKKFIIADYLSEGLTFNEGSVRIYNYDDSKEENKGTELTDDFVDYAFTDEKHPAEGTSPSFAKSFTGDYSILAEKVIVEYSATVNEKAVVKEEADPDNKLDNKVYLIYNNNPYTEDGYREIPDKERVYTYGIQVTKTDNGEKKLPGAEFNLKQGEDTLKFVKDGNVYRLPLTEEEAAEASETLVTDANGLIMIKGLDLGTYTLIETKAPDGYELPANPETVITLADDADDSGKPDGILNNDSDGTFETTVVNTKPGILPVTGGIGTALFTICGLLLMSGAVILVVTVSRRKSR